MTMKSSVPQLRIATIGSGLMAKSHTLGYQAVATVYDGEVPLRPQLDVLVDQNEELAAAGAHALGYERHSTDWRAAVDDPAIDLVDIVTPNWLHYDIAMAAIEAGKHVYCEKPLALTAPEARRMADAAAAAGVTTLVGFSYLRNPAIQLAKKLIEAGEIGEIWSVRGNFSLDAVSDPGVPFTWRMERALAGSGALGDVGAHVIALARLLAGPIGSVVGQLKTVVPARPEPAGVFGYGMAAREDSPLREVENDDLAHFLATFANGASGIFEASRVSTGRAFDLGIEVVGSRGSLRFDQQHDYRLEVSLPGADGSIRGAREVAVEPGHGDYGRLWPFAGVPVGLHEIKVLEIRELLDAIAEGRPGDPGFEEGAQVSAVLDAVELSVAERRWVDLEARSGGEA